MRGMPEIFLVGAQKAGTTSLHIGLLDHPDVREGRCPITGCGLKEIDYFTGNWERGEQWYESHFPDNQGVYIDSTPECLPAIHVHKRLAAFAPDARILITLRDPVARAYSQYNHYKQDLPKSRGFDWPCPEGDFARNICADLEDLDAEPQSYYGLVSRGLYVDQIMHLCQFYPREQIRVMIMER